MAEQAGTASSLGRRLRNKENIRVDTTGTAPGIVDMCTDWVAYNTMDICKVAEGRQRALWAHVAQTTRRGLLLEFHRGDGYQPQIARHLYLNVLQIIGGLAPAGLTGGKTQGESMTWKRAHLRDGLEPRALRHGQLGKAQRLVP